MFYSFKNFQFITFTSSIFNIFSSIELGASGLLLIPASVPFEITTYSRVLIQNLIAFVLVKCLTIL